MPYLHYQLVLSWYLHQPESHQLNLQNLPQSVRIERLGPIDQIPETAGSSKKAT